jgi:hypothetical protein
MPGLSHVWSLNAEAFRAIGRPDIWPKLGMLTLLVLMPLLIFLAPFGLVALTIGRLVGAAVLPVSIIVVSAKIFDAPVGEQIAAVRGPLIAGISMYAVATLMMRAFEPFTGFEGGAKLFVVVGGGVFCYLLLLRTLCPDLTVKLLHSIRRTWVNGSK